MTAEEEFRLRLDPTLCTKCLGGGEIKIATPDNKLVTIVGVFCSCPLGRKIRPLIVLPAMEIDKKSITQRLYKWILNE